MAAEVLQDRLVVQGPVVQGPPFCTSPESRVAVEPKSANIKGRHAVVPRHLAARLDRTFPEGSIQPNESILEIRMSSPQTI